MMPAQKPGKSKQDYQTPPELLDAVREELGITQFTMDLAADDTNHICPDYFTTEVDAFDFTWARGGWNWLNPPFGNIRPWVKKAWEETSHGARTAVLVPASVGSNWWKNWVHGKAGVLFLNGRVQFVGAEGLYPKDCAILLYKPHTVGGYAVWSWK